MLDLYNSKAYEPLHLPGMIYGKELTGEKIPIAACSEHLGTTITVDGFIKDMLFRDIKSSHLLVVLELEDKSGNSVKGKLITKKQYKEELKAALQIGELISLSGMMVYDQFDSAYVMECITGIKKMNDYYEVSS